MATLAEDAATRIRDSSTLILICDLAGDELSDEVLLNWFAIVFLSLHELHPDEFHAFLCERMHPTGPDPDESDICVCGSEKTPPGGQCSMVTDA
jgi:hypothetical protein